MERKAQSEQSVKNRKSNNKYIDYEQYKRELVKQNLTVWEFAKKVRDYCDEHKI